MTAYAVRLANGIDTAPRMRMADALNRLGATGLNSRTGLRPGSGGTVAVVAGTMQVTVSAFLAWVDGNGSDAQGGYPFVLDASANLTVDAGHASLARVDTVAGIVYEDSYDGTGQTKAEVVVVKGTPGAGAPVLPASAVPLRDINVPAGLSAGTGGLASANLGTDRRAWAVAAGGVAPVASTAERNALTAYRGMVVYRTDTDRLEAYDGNTWQPYVPQSQMPVVKSFNVTTDASGYAVLTHGLGWTPAAADVQLATTAAMTSYTSWGLDSLTATTVRVRVVQGTGSVAANVTAPIYITFHRSLG